jgi:hypothetical protein
MEFHQPAAFAIVGLRYEVGRLKGAKLEAAFACALSTRADPTGAGGARYSLPQPKPKAPCLDCDARKRRFRAAYGSRYRVVQLTSRTCGARPTLST